jgi:hypothetical protein
MLNSITSFFGRRPTRNFDRENMLARHIEAKITMIRKGENMIRVSFEEQG